MLSLFNNLFKAKPNVFGNAVREYAARKGTREKRLRLKKKRKQEVASIKPKKKTYGRAEAIFVRQRPIDDSKLAHPVDNVFFMNSFRKPEFKFNEVVQFHREVHHETVYNRPAVPLYVRVDIDLTLPNRKTKCQEPWKSLIELRTPFLMPGHPQPSILAFCRENLDEIEMTLEAGAEKAGGAELIEAVQEGTVRPSEYDYVITHPLVVESLTPIRGLMKRQFPATRTGTLHADLPALVKTLKNSVRLQLQYHDKEPDFGHFVAVLGNLNMDTEDLEGNFKAYLRDTIRRKPTGKDADKFIVRCTAFTYYSLEKLKVNWRGYLPDK